MSITNAQKQIVQQTFSLVASHAEDVASLFYSRLFEIDPSLRPMFRGDLKEQGRKLIQMLSVAVAALNSLDTLIPAVEALGARHVNYGVSKQHYATVGEALLWTLEKGLGTAFTAEVRDAWTTVYGVLADVATGKAYEQAVA